MLFFIPAFVEIKLVRLGWLEDGGEIGVTIEKPESDAKSLKTKYPLSFLCGRCPIKQTYQFGQRHLFLLGMNE